MGLEAATKLSQLNALWPLGTDPRSQGDDHIRLVKSAVKADAVAKAETLLQTVVGPMKIGKHYIGRLPDGTAGLDYLSISAGDVFTLNSGLPSSGVTYVFRDSAAVGVARIDAVGTAAPDTLTLMTREKADARFVASGGTGVQAVGGALQVGNYYIGGTSVGAVNTIYLSSMTGTVLAFQSGEPAANVLASVRDAAGSIAALIGPNDAAAASPKTVMVRDKADARYVSKASTAVETMAGALKAGDYYLGALPDGSVSSAYISAATNVSFNFRSGFASTGVQALFRGSDNVVVARVEAVGTAASSTNTIITREKGDLRYQAASSLRFKESVITREAGPSLTAVFDALTVKGWTWGGELPDSDERVGKPGLGFIAEEVEALLPEAVTYQWRPVAEGETETEQQVLGLDPLALIAVLAAKIAELEASVANLTTPPARAA